MTQPRPRPGRAAGPVAIDLQALQSPSTRTRGIGRYTYELACAIEGVDPDIVGRYLLNPRLAPPASIDALLATGKVSYSGGAALEGVEVLHVCSPLDTTLRLGELWPDEARERAVALSASVIDLLPALEPDVFLAEPVERRRYQLLVEALRRADAFQTLSSAVATDVASLLGTPRHGTVVVGAAPDPCFVAPLSRTVAAEGAALRLAPLGLNGPRYVLAPSGSHPRKNNERLVIAWASLRPEVRDGRQLVITGEIDAPTRHHYEHLASVGGAAGSVVSVGFVDDELLVLTYQGAELVCVPFLAEGFGLPIVEALACGAAVIASNRPPLDDFVSPEGLFDPMSKDAIASAIDSALGDQALLERLRVPRRRLDTWSAVGSRSARALDDLRRSSRRPTRPSARRRRPRLAFASPFPPAPTGVAGYSARLVAAIERTEKVEIDCFSDGPDARRSAALYPGVRSVASLFATEAMCGRYDHVVVTLGNSHHHLGALALLRERPSTVLAHDVRLSNLYRHENGDPSMRRGGLGRAIDAMYGPLTPELGSNDELSAADIERYGIVMAREAVACSLGFLVSSQAAAALARLDAGPELAERVGVLPFALAAPETSGNFVEEPRPAPEGLPPELAARWGQGPGLVAGAVIAHFGIVDPVKLPGVVLEAVAVLRRADPGVTVAFVGPVSDAVARDLASTAAELGIPDAVTLTGPLAPADYGAWFSSASVAVQLRASSNGEASAAVGECLAAGLPTVVSRLGWTAELPDEAVVKLATPARADALAGELGALLGDSARRRALRDGAQRVASDASFDKTARQLLAILEELAVRA